MSEDGVRRGLERALGAFRWKLQIKEEHLRSCCEMEAAFQDLAAAGVPSKEIAGEVLKYLENSGYTQSDVRGHGVSYGSVRNALERPRRM